MGINARALPAHLKRQIPGLREARKRQVGQSGKPAILRAAGVDSEPELILANRLERAGLPMGEPQYRFVPGRQYRFDRAYPDQKVAVEVQGGIWTNGAHSRGSGVSRDCVKYSIAAALGWRVLPVTVEMIEDGTAVQLIRQALGVSR
jgi:hypothetical protein